MKLWVVAVLIIVMICLAVPFVTADDKKGGIGKGGKIKTPVNVEIKPADDLGSLKKVVGMKTDTNIEVTIDGNRLAILPNDSPLRNVSISEECLTDPYGSVRWYNCEVS